MNITQTAWKWIPVTIYSKYEWQVEQRPIQSSEIPAICGKRMEEAFVCVCVWFPVLHTFAHSWKLFVYDAQLKKTYPDF